MKVGDLVAFEGFFGAMNLAIIRALIPAEHGGGVVAWFSHHHEAWYSRLELAGDFKWEIISKHSSE
mgnify:CR=1 FL=1